MPSSSMLPPLEDHQLGQTAFDALAAARAALGPLTSRVPRTNPSYAARQVLELRSLFTPQDEAKLLALLSEAFGAQVRDALEQLRTLAHATRFAAAQFEVEQEQQRVAARLPWRTQIEQAQQLRVVGLHWVGVLNQLGLISDAVLAALRAGQGHDDLAKDLQALGRLLLEHWKVLAALQEHQANLTLRLTEQSAGALQRAGAELLEALAAGGPAIAPAIDWHDEQLRCYALLRQAYETVRHPAILYFQVTGQPEQAARFISLEGMRRPAVRRTPNDDPPSGPPPMP